jgi:hypothetical protein
MSHLEPGTPSWSDPSLAVPSDDAWTAKYRRLQSWYRETVLHARPAPSGKRALVGSMLADDDVKARPTLNFLTDEVAAYVARRVPEVHRAGGSLEEHRLEHNMLSSMPLCFNLFGHLRAHLTEAAAVLPAVLRVPMARVEDIQVEWAPPPEEHLGDRTAFDAVVFYRTPRGGRGLVAIETKYTEQFSATEYDLPTYRALTVAPLFRDGAAAKLREKATNQLWRNTLLATSVAAKEGFDEVRVAVVACAGDAKVEKAVSGLRGQLVEPDALVRAVTLEELVSPFAELPATAAWARAFRERYLDLAPVARR